MSTALKVLTFIIQNWKVIWELIKDIREMWDNENVSDNDRKAIENKAREKGRKSLSVLDATSVKYQRRCK